MGLKVDVEFVSVILTLFILLDKVEIIIIFFRRCKVRKVFYVLLLLCFCFYSCLTVPSKQTSESDQVESTEEVSKKDEVLEEEIPQEEVKDEPVLQVEAEMKEEVKVEPRNEVIAEFGDVKITKKDYHDTMNEVKVIVDSLNKVAATSDYTKWLTFLSETYKKEFSNTATLDKTVASLKKKNVTGLKLQNLKDYFKYVFVASRQNIKVDDIEFLSPVRVNVLMLASGKKLLVYDLEKINGRWLLMPRL